MGVFTLRCGERVAWIRGIVARVVRTGFGISFEGGAEDLDWKCERQRGARVVSKTLDLRDQNNELALTEREVSQGTAGRCVCVCACVCWGLDLKQTY